MPEPLVGIVIGAIVIGIVIWGIYTAYKMDQKIEEVEHALDISIRRHTNATALIEERQWETIIEGHLRDLYSAHETAVLNLLRDLFEKKYESDYPEYFSNKCTGFNLTHSHNQFVFG